MNTPHPSSTVPTCRTPAALGETAPQPDHRNPPPSPLPLLIDGREAARLLGVSERTLHTLAMDNIIPSHKVGRLRRYNPSELQAWVAAGCPKPSIAKTCGGGAS